MQACVTHPTTAILLRPPLNYTCIPREIAPASTRYGCFHCHIFTVCVCVRLFCVRVACIVGVGVCVCVCVFTMRSDRVFACLPGNCLSRAIVVRLCIRCSVCYWRVLLNGYCSRGSRAGDSYDNTCDLSTCLCRMLVLHTERAANGMRSHQASNQQIEFATRNLQLLVSGVVAVFVYFVPIDV